MTPRPFSITSRSRAPSMIFPDRREAVHLATEGQNLALYWVRSLVPDVPQAARYADRVLCRASEQPGVFAAIVSALIETGNIDAAQALCKRMSGR